ncbi:MAG TPA: GAF domain-containing protein [Chloroflexota bacterium]|nr:GAF domain-containing protein [Chloroflexota bacterium]
MTVAAISSSDGPSVSPIREQRRTGGEIPAQYLRRVLSLSASLGPESSLDSFAAHVAALAREIGDFHYTVIYLYDSADNAFYAEARQGIGIEDWQEILAMPIPRRVYDRLMGKEGHVTAPLVIRPDSPAFADQEVGACLLPVLSPLIRTSGDSGSAPEPQAASDRTLVLVPLDVPGRGVVGLCAGVRGGKASSPVQLRALSALAAQGAVFLENIHLYRAQLEEAAVSSALLKVASALGTTDVDTLVEGTLSMLPRLFGAQFAGLLYLDTRRVELRMLEPTEPDGGLKTLTEIKISGPRLEQMTPLLHGTEPVAVEEHNLSRSLPERLIQTRGLRSAIIIPLNLSNRAADALMVCWTEAPHRFRSRDLEVARGVGELVGVALANAQLFDDASARAEQLSSLYRTGQMMSSSLDLDATLRTITEAAVQLTHSRLCFIYLIDQKSGLLDFEAGSGLDTFTEVGPPRRPGEGLIGRSALLGKPLLVDDLLEDPKNLAAEPLLSDDVRSALFIPLIAGGEVIGVLTTAAEVPGYFLSEHQQILQAFANQAAVAIERARLYAAELRRREVAELQQAMTQALGATLELRDVLDQVLKFVGMLVSYELAGVHVINDGRIDLAVIGSSSGQVTTEPFHGPYVFAEPLYQQMRDAGSAMVVSDTAREPLWREIAAVPRAASWIAVPLLMDGDYVVILEVFSLSHGAYTQEDADAISQFANQVSFAVRNARTYAREHEAKTRLEELDQLRTDFVSTVSHELRTPLTGIKGFTETLLNYWTRLDDERRHHYLDRIHGASKRLQRLVQDLLFVSRVEGGTLPLSIRSVQLADLIEPSISEIQQKYRGQVVLVDVPADLPEVLADADRAQQILLSLMDNGVKYSPEGAEILVRCLVLPEAVQVTVIDHGLGIREQDMPRLFTRFGKIDQVIRAGHVGTGLGLFIARQLVEQMNGVIEVRSVVGQGSEFSFTIPRADR